MFSEKEGKLDGETHTGGHIRGDGHMAMEVEFEVTQLQAGSRSFLMNASYVVVPCRDALSLED